MRNTNMGNDYLIWENIGFGTTLYSNDTQMAFLGLILILDMGVLQRKPSLYWKIRDYEI